MKVTEVHLINIDKPISKKSISKAFERVSGVNRVDEISWKDYPYLPEVTFKIARISKGFLLHYDVMEEYVRAKYINTNDPVYEDSCVEFFLSTDGRYYYNFEFNCIGTALIGFGTSREKRKWIEPGRIEQIRRFPSCSRNYFLENAERKGHYKWELSIYIPFSFFRETDKLRKTFRGRGVVSEIGGEKTYRANFYKCGDKLPLPHYVSWNRIATKSPDFHRPEYFGKLVFME